MTDFAGLLPVAHEAVRLAREIMTTRRPGVLTAKGERDMATEVDYAVEEQVRAFLDRETPTSVSWVRREAGAVHPVA
ncbi:hypothetical protein [Actinoplanes sp. NPDC051859]|uniref:hypothetical protein n=1 Tax=Actinoplanes sp. NPDC051859 TaxID=3363909 RepID=UPI0037913EFD